MPEPKQKLGFPFDGKYLRILTPRTTNGIVPMTDEETDVVILKETHAPLSAKRYYEQQNEVLPKHLRHRITEIDTDAPKEATEEEKAVMDKKKIPAKGKKETDSQTSKEDEL